MIVIESTDLIQGDATTAAEVDYTIYGLDNNVLTQIADGQLPNAKGTLYTADSTDVVTTVILVNTGAGINNVNLYLKPSSGTSRRLIPKNLQLRSGYSLHWEGGKAVVLNTYGEITQTIETTVSGAVMKSDYDAKTILIASADDSPVAALISGTTLPGSGIDGQTFLDTDLPGFYVWNT